jgi:asparagine synthase (glutamine-hydrolysing)
MCGIVGRINFNGSAVDKASLVTAADSLHHRGPNDSGYWNEFGCGFAHRRLSIHDLTETGHQPMLSYNERYVCVFNGEIYNYKKLKDQLSSDGICWRGESDTEVLVEGWSAWGIQLLDKIDGMFAFVIWDRHEKRLFAVRDRMGEKPFYYHSNTRQFGFSSRPTQLFTIFPGLSSEYNEQAIRLFLEGGYVPAPHSIYQQVKKLPAAHYLIVDETGIEIKRYWDFRNIEPNMAWKNRSEGDLLDELDEILTRSVSERMASDVPLGAFLSGGIDSTLMAALMQKQSASPIKTFTIGFDVDKYDESRYAKSVSEYLHTEHYCEQLQVKQLLELMPKFLQNYDEPFFDSAAFPTMAVSRLARQHVTVSITGDGGDELFGGYHYYQIARVMEHFFSLPNWMRSMTAATFSMIPRHNFKLLGAALKEKNSARAFAFSRSIAKDFQNIVSTNILQRTKSLKDLFEHQAAGFPAGLHASEEGMRLDMLYTLNDDYLQKTDVASMAFSLESRSPILSRETIEWSSKLPISWKLKGGISKYLLRQLSYRYVPRSIMDRPKRGFGVPIDSWLRNDLSVWAEEKINDSQNFQGLPLNQNSVRELFQLHKSGVRNVHPLLWSVLMLLEFNSKKF